MLGVEIEFGNLWTLSVTSSYKPTKAKTPARSQGFFEFQMVARGGIEQGRELSKYRGQSNQNIGLRIL